MNDFLPHQFHEPKPYPKLESGKGVALGGLNEQTNWFEALRTLEYLKAEVDPALQGHFAGWGKGRKRPQEPARLGQKPFLHFAPSDIQAQRYDAAREVLYLQLANFGLWGPNGALPVVFTELAFRRLHHQHDPALVEFVDIFHHGLFGLFYRAWAQANFHVGKVGCSTPLRLLNAFAGGVAEPQASSRSHSIHSGREGLYSHWVSQVRQPEGLRKLLSSVLGCRVSVYEAHGVWITNPAPPKLGRQARLAAGAMVGRRVWSVQEAISLDLGPMSWGALIRLRSELKWRARVEATISDWLRGQWTARAALFVDPKSIPQATLGRQAEPYRLGVSAWLGRRIGPRPLYAGQLYRANERRPIDAGEST